MSLDGFIPCAVRRLSGMAVELYGGIVLPRLGLNLCEGKAACLADKQHGTLDRITSLTSWTAFRKVSSFNSMFLVIAVSS